MCITSMSIHHALFNDYILIHYRKDPKVPLVLGSVETRELKDWLFHENNRLPMYMNAT